MGYHILDPTDMAALPDRPSETVTISEAAGLENLGVRLYEVAPGEQMPKVYHYHDEQEEVFYVVAGRLGIETPDEDLTVTSGQFFVAKPGDPHRAFNPDGADEAATVVAVGAPAVEDAHPYEP